jgi:hypothetical protein
MKDELLKVKAKRGNFREPEDGIKRNSKTEIRLDA